MKTTSRTKPVKNVQAARDLLSEIWACNSAARRHLDALHKAVGRDTEWAGDMSRIANDLLDVRNMCERMFNEMKDGSD